MYPNPTDPRYSTDPAFTCAQWDSVVRCKNDRIAQLEKALASALRSCDDLEKQRDGLSDDLDGTRDNLLTAEAVIRDQDRTIRKLWNRIDKAREALA